MRNIKTLPLLFLLLCPSLQAFAQSNINRLAYIKENAVAVINIEPLNEDYSDLALLKKSLEHVLVQGSYAKLYDGLLFINTIRATIPLN
ncbi:hypothetical protein [Pontibacter pudoricolor]|jgi:hypothetical protein|uniref:hypothetical protein n=1 Tax=Pontibacter pudoricolor TaxID=2694930 RepID=UPI0013918B9E|nr:hypothetical protein [Pontibacter pudoricolor]